MIGSFGIFEGRGWNFQPEGEIQAIKIDVITEDPKIIHPEMNYMLERLIADGKAIGRLTEDLYRICAEEFCNVH